MRSLGIIFSIGFAVFAGAAQAQMSVALSAPWDGVTVPAGQNCTLQGGNGATPEMTISGIPEGTVSVHVEYNDLSYKPLSSEGGHGVIGFTVSASQAVLPSVAGLTADLPQGVFLVRKARSSGDYASEGYLPPCSGGNGNDYSATVKALDASGIVLGQTVVSIGRY
jgi:hypothetical protein